MALAKSCSSDGRRGSRMERALPPSPWRRHCPVVSYRKPTVMALTQAKFTRARRFSGGFISNIKRASSPRPI